MEKVTQKEQRSRNYAIDQRGQHAQAKSVSLPTYTPYICAKTCQDQLEDVAVCFKIN